MDFLEALDAFEDTLINLFSDGERQKFFDWKAIRESGGPGNLLSLLGMLFDDAEDTVSPLTFDLDGDGVETLGIDAGIQFDHDANGCSERTGWVGKDDGLLVWDRNANGQIDSGKELFGNNTALAAAGGLAANGFLALADLDSNHDGAISASDANFDQLRVWKDLDSDGVTDSGELLTLSGAGVQSISLSYSESGRTDAQGNEHRQLGTYTRTAGGTRAIEDIWFADGNQPIAAFKALIELPHQRLDANGLNLPLGAGMQVSAEIHQGTRTVLEYLLSPVQRVTSEAGGER